MTENQPSGLRPLTGGCLCVAVRFPGAGGSDAPAGERRAAPAGGDGAPELARDPGH